eukprot:791176-Prorocentrum_lima.AAC.1
MRVHKHGKSNSPSVLSADMSGPPYSALLIFHTVPCSTVPTLARILGTLTRMTASLLIGLIG